MVKSYRGVQQAKPLPKAQKVSVADYMSTKLITFRPDQHMDEVIETLLKNKISGGPVVNEHGELVGIISEGDCMKEVVRGKYNNMPNLNGKVSEHMTTGVISISPETNIFDAAKMFLDKRDQEVSGGQYGQTHGPDFTKRHHESRAQHAE